ncbi:MAG: DUF177 domain-containing protein [Lachnospiraceae bacterium]|nr:DUF177 domain-containing protein [Lachnospiraceae bacterium]
MLINLTDVFSSEGKVVQMQVDLEMVTYENQHVTYTITDKTPISVTFSNTGNGKAHMEGHVKLTMILSCDRCLKDVIHEFDLSFTEELVSPEVSDDLSEDMEDGRDFMEGYSINIEDLISNEILINWPTKVLCSEVCKGICKQCGKDLNEGECGCDTFVPDPRMAVIKDIFNANKEV